MFPLHGHGHAKDLFVLLQAASTKDGRAGEDFTTKLDTIVHTQPEDILNNSTSSLNKWGPKHPSPPTKFSMGLLQLKLMAFMNWLVWPPDTARYLSEPVGLAILPWLCSANLPVKANCFCFTAGSWRTSKASQFWSKAGFARTNDTSLGIYSSSVAWVD